MSVRQVQQQQTHTPTSAIDLNVGRSLISLMKSFMFMKLQVSYHDDKKIE